MEKNNLGFIAPPANTLHLSHVTMLVRKGESSNSAYSTLLDHTHSLHSGRGHTQKKEGKPLYSISQVTSMLKRGTETVK